MSRNNEATDPGFALALNPFNSEAAVNLVVTSLNGQVNPDLPTLSEAARTMIWAAPGDARGYSVMGAVAEREGNSERAGSLYATALQQSKSELHALLRTAQTRLEASDTPGALEQIDLLLRRWPTYWDQVEPVLLRIAAREDTGPLLAEMLDGIPPWRGRALNALAKEPATLRFLRSLIASASQDVRTRPAWTAERDGVVAALVNNKAYVEAYSLFLSTLTPQEAEVAGYVFDGGFRLPVGRGYFGWRTQRPGATEVRFGSLARTGGSGLSVRFLDSPARPGIVTQNLMLPFGDYRLGVDASAAGLRAPKELFWSVRCAEGPQLAMLPLASGTTSDTRLEIDFTVPASGCSRQVLSLDTKVRTESWRDRYQGAVTFNDLVITRL